MTMTVLGRTPPPTAIDVGVTRDGRVIVAPTPGTPMQMLRGRLGAVLRYCGVPAALREGVVGAVARVPAGLRAHIRLEIVGSRWAFVGQDVFGGAVPWHRARITMYDGDTGAFIASGAAGTFLRANPGAENADVRQDIAAVAKGPVGTVRHVGGGAEAHVILKHVRASGAQR
jgi:hypothetical protein